MANETPNRVHAGGMFVPVLAAPFPSNILNSQGVQGFTRLSTGQYQIALQRPLAFAEGYAEAAVPANFQAVAGAQLAEDGASVLVTVLALGTGVPVDPPLVSCTVWSVREGEGEGPSIPFPAIPPPIPGGSTSRFAWFEAETATNYFTYRDRGVATTASFNFNIRVPPDFGTLTKLVLVGAPNASYVGTGEIDLESNYGANAESVTNHNDFDSLTGLSGTADVMLEIDLMGVVPSLAAGDMCGINMDHVTGIGSAGNYFGIEMEYTTP